MLGSAGVRTLNYGSPVNWNAPLNRGLQYWWRVLPLRTGGNTWVDLARQQSVPFTSLLPATKTTGFGSTSRRGGMGEVRFNGTTSMVDTGLTAAQLGMTQTVKGVAVWALPLGAATAIPDSPWYGAFLWGDQGQTFCVSRANVAGTDRFWAYNWDGVDTFFGITYTVGQWTHLVYVHTGGNLLLYKDGVLRGTTPSGSSGGVTNAVRFGKIDNANGWFEGALDDFRFYNLAPSASEVTALYQASLRGYPQELNWRTWPPAFARTAVTTGHGLLLAGRRNRLVEVAA